MRYGPDFTDEEKLNILNYTKERMEVIRAYIAGTGSKEFVDEVDRVYGSIRQVERSLELDIEKKIKEK